jgi:adenosylmethionine-8-amino-7-oxononanoate aminotransferase
MTKADEGRDQRPAHGGGQDLFYASKTTAEFPRIVRGQGVHLWDDAGNRYLDVASGAFLANLGQGNDRVLRAMYEEGRRFTYAYVRNTRHEANTRLAERLTRLAGPGFERAYLCSSGSDAVEVALQFLRQYVVATGQPDRRWVITLMPSYHGGTFATIGMNGDHAAPDVYGPMAVFSEKVPTPLTCRAPSPEAAARATVAALRETIGRVAPETVLAFVCEPVGEQASGANVPDPLFSRISWCSPRASEPATHRLAPSSLPPDWSTSWPVSRVSTCRAGRREPHRLCRRQRRPGRVGRARAD